WEFYLARLGIVGVSKIDSLLIFLSGFVLTITPGKVGEVFKSAVLLRTHGVPMERSAPIIVAERLTDAIAVVVLILIGSLGFNGGLLWAGLGSAMVLLGMLFIIWPMPAEILLRLVARTPLQALGPKLRTALESLRVLASPSALLIPTALSVLAWGAEGCALYVLLMGFGTHTSFALALFFYSTATLAGALIPVPGGLGVTDGMLQKQLVQLGGVSSGIATSSMIMVRFATLWWAVLIGFAALAGINLRYPGKVSAVDSKAPQGS
ncbi:MAG TPA: lysylphosphatidylglycerol synthase transmembrane domain-containing protein, partial [Polyangiaceae bacterium]|nr:lysylphosphatidylglycerol synthase transmembrane domain-containing protein [Polyangiaceae bacterium]